jgi:hypothetical protein
LYGNPDHLNTRYPSGISMAGESDPTYWPKYSDSNVGEHEITGMVIQYEKQLIFTTGDSSGASAWYSTKETVTDSTTGITTTLFPVFPMNGKVGNMAKGQVSIIQNNPFTVWKGIYEWVSTYVLDEKNAQWISARIQNDLNSVDLSTAIVVDWDDKGLYWLCVGKKVWVYNYRENVKTWYILDLAHAPTCFLSVDGKMCFGTDTGTIMQFDESYLTYDGEAISANWEMGFYDFSAEWLL